MRADESEDNFTQWIGKLGHGIGLGADRAVGGMQSGGTAVHAASVATGTQPPGSLSAELLNAAVPKNTSGSTVPPKRSTPLQTASWLASPRAAHILRRRCRHR